MQFKLLERATLSQFIRQKIPDAWSGSSKTPITGAKAALEITRDVLLFIFLAIMFLFTLVAYNLTHTGDQRQLTGSHIQSFFPGGHAQSFWAHSMGQ